MSALTLLIWERCDFSSSRSSSSRCAFFMASMAAGDGTGLVPGTALPKRRLLERVFFLFAVWFLQEQDPSQPSELPHCFPACAPGHSAAKGLLQILLYNKVQTAGQFPRCFLNCRAPTAEILGIQYLRWWQPSPPPAGGPSPPAASPAPAGAAAAGPRSSSGASPPWLQSPFHMLPARGTRGRGWPGSSGAGITAVGEPLGSCTPAGGGHPASITRVCSLPSHAGAG